MKDNLVFIINAIECVTRCQKYTKGLTLSQFQNDIKTQDAVIRNIEILGQSLKDFGVGDLQTDYPNINWNALAGMRNILAHEYLGIDLDIVWQTVINDIIPLETTLKSIQHNHTTEQN